MVIALLAVKRRSCRGSTRFGGIALRVRTLRTPAADATVVAPLAAEVPVQMYAFLRLVDTLISIFIWLLIAQAVLSWLVSFGVVNRYNRVVSTVGDFLWRVTEPLLRPIRRVLPDLGGVGILPGVLVFVFWVAGGLRFG